MRRAAHRILLVDDDPFVRIVVRRSLIAEGYVVQTADNGSSAIKRLRISPPDLLLLDMTEPRVNGLEVLSWMQQNSCEVPVIVLSGKYSGEPITLGVTTVLSKSVELDQLLATVRTALKT